MSATGKTLRNRKNSDELPIVTLDELARHNSESDLWMAVEGRVYDLTKYLKYHPGGGVLKTWAGRDATDPFRAYHRAFVNDKLPAFLVGRLPPKSEAETEYER